MWDCKRYLQSLHYQCSRFTFVSSQFGEAGTCDIIWIFSWSAEQHCVAPVHLCRRKEAQQLRKYWSKLYVCTLYLLFFFFLSRAFFKWLKYMWSDTGRRVHSVWAGSRKHTQPAAHPDKPKARQKTQGQRTHRSENTQEWGEGRAEL